MSSQLRRWLTNIPMLQSIMQTSPSQANNIYQLRSFRQLRRVGTSQEEEVSREMRCLDDVQFSGVDKRARCGPRAPCFERLQQRSLHIPLSSRSCPAGSTEAASGSEVKCMCENCSLTTIVNKYLDSLNHSANSDGQVLSDSAKARARSGINFPCCAGIYLSH